VRFVISLPFPGPQWCTANPGWPKHPPTESLRNNLMTVLFSIVMPSYNLAVSIQASASATSWFAMSTTARRPRWSTATRASSTRFVPFVPHPLSNRHGSGEAKPER